MIGFLRNRIKKAIFYSIYRWDQRRLRKSEGLHDCLPYQMWDLNVNSKGHLVVQDSDLVKLAERYGTPLYVVDEKRLENNYIGFLSSVRRKYPKVEIAYSYKTNPVPGVLKFLHRLGSSAEVISEFELWLAQKLGLEGERIIYNGPAKTRSGIRAAVSNKVRLINIDNLTEIDVIDELAREYGVRQKIGVRVVTSVGWSSQFGLGIHNKRAFEAFQIAKSRESLLACGLHLHLGTGIRKVETYLRAIEEVLEFADLLRRRLEIHIEYLDFGGGFGVPTVRPFSSLDVKMMQNDFPPRIMEAQEVGMDKYAGAIMDLVRQYYPLERGETPTIIFEPGRAITSSAQSLLLKVIVIKANEGRADTAILDGGKNITMPMAYEYHEIFVASKMKDSTHGYYNLFGPLCHPHDVLFRYKELPKLAPGDILAVMDAGAYFVPNQMNFSNPRPGIVMVSLGREDLVRKHESFDDIVGRDIMGKV